MCKTFSYIRNMIDTLYAPRLSQDLLVKEVLDTEIGIIHFYDNIIVMEGKENAIFSIKTGLFILLKVIKIVGNKPMVYISNRVNSYSVDPNDYKYLEMIPNLQGIATVSYNHFAKGSAKLEQKFFKKQFRDFESLDDAKFWAMEVLKENSI